MGEFALPAAPPQRYLRWMAYWREVESQMLSNPAVEAVASREAAPFLRGEMAAFISTIVGTIVDTAMGAKEAGQELVAPVIELPDREVARAIADLVERRGAWLDAHAGSLGIVPLESELISLRESTVALLRAPS
jgi:hypothetical protein